MKRFFISLLSLMLIACLGFAALAYDYWDMSLASYEVTPPANRQYVYMYAKPNSSGNAIASYRTGTVVRVIDYDASANYCYAIGPDNKVGYLSKAYLTVVSDYSYDDEALDEYVVIAQQKYVYTFKETNESGQPVGTYTNDTVFKMVDYDSNELFAYVIAPDNKLGYIRKALIMKVYDYDDESYPSYRVTSTYSTGYLYMYPDPSSNGTPIAKYNNGTILKVVNYDISATFCLAVGPNGTAGYVAKNQLTEETDSGKLGPVFEVFSSRKYCYMYAKPNSGSTNLGRYNNGDQIEIIDWGADASYAFVRGVKDNKYGYIQKASLHPSSVNPVKGYMKIASPNRDYVYLYEKASTGSTNLGRYMNGTQIGIIDWAASDGFALVYTPDEKVGFMAKNSLVSLFN